MGMYYYKEQPEGFCVRCAFYTGRKVMLPSDRLRKIDDISGVYCWSCANHLLSRRFDLFTLRKLDRTYTEGVERLCGKQKSAAR